MRIAVEAGSQWRRDDLLAYGPKLYPDFPLNGNWMMLFSMLAGIASFIVVSLLTCRQPHNMDQLLHRGEYAIPEDNVVPAAVAAIPTWKRVLLGYDENFTRGDRFISASLFGWTALMFGAFAVITLINIAFGAWSEQTWWRWIVFYNVFLPLAVGAVTTVWFTIGGLIDVRRLFEKLRTMPHDARDDGILGVDAYPPAAVSPSPQLAVMGAPTAEAVQPSA